MYAVYNPTNNIFFVKNILTGETHKIGNKYQFLCKIAYRFSYKGDMRYEGNWILDNSQLAFNENDLQCEEEFNRELYIKEYKYTQRKYVYVDGLDRILNPRDFLKDIMHYYMLYGHPFYWPNEYKSNRSNREYQGRKSHTGYSWRGKNRSNLKWKKQQNDMLKKDLGTREYHFKRVGDGKEFELSWDFDRPYSGNWKAQYKCNKQYNIHTSVKNTASIRRRYDDEFLKDEIDYMLEMDFLSYETEN